MFPNYGKAFLEAVCQYYHLQTVQDSELQSELQRVVGIVLNNQLPRDLAILNKNAKTMRDLYVGDFKASEKQKSAQQNDDKEKKNVLQSLFDGDELKRVVILHGFERS